MSRSLLAAGISFVWLAVSVAGPMPGKSRRIGGVAFVYEGAASLEDIEGNGTDPEVAIREIKGEVNLPLFLGESSRVMSGVRVEMNRFHFDGIGLDDQDVYTVSIPFRLIADVSEKWTLFGGLSPSIYSDFEHVTGDDFKTSLFVLGFYRMTPALTTGIGAVYSREFGSDRFYPAAGVTWDVTEKLTLNAVFPRPALVYRATEKMTASVFMVPAGSEWSIEESIDGTDRDCDLKLKGYRCGAGLDYVAFGRVRLFVEGGMVFGRDYELTCDDETIMESDVEDTWFVGTGISIL